MNLSLMDIFLQYLGSYAWRSYRRALQQLVLNYMETHENKGKLVFCAGMDELNLKNKVPEIWPTCYDN